MVDFLLDQGIKLTRHPYWPDYYSNAPGASESGRTVYAELFDASVLGEARKKLRPNFVPVPVKSNEMWELPLYKTTWLGKKIMTKVALRMMLAKLTGKHWQPSGAALQGRMFEKALKAVPGAPLSWDNVIHGTQLGLGYVVATHQSLNPAPGPTVLTWYCAPGESARGDLLRQPWTHWRDLALAELSPVHPDLARKVTHVEVARYGHAMSIPVPGTLSRMPAPPDGSRVSYAHSDWAGYSIFEEAFTLGHHAGRRAAA